MSDKWLEELRKTREETENEMEETHKEEEKRKQVKEQSKEQYKEEHNRIMTTIENMFKDVVAEFSHKSVWVFPIHQPKYDIDINSDICHLYVPISNNIRIPFSMTFRLVLGEKGYLIEIDKISYDVVRESQCETTDRIISPTTENMQQKIISFLNERKDIVKKLEEIKRSNIRRD